MPVSVSDLLHGLMIQSGNDAAVAIAEAVAGDEATFVTLMNREAQRMGLKGTRFANPHGRVFDRWGELLFEGKDLPIGSEPLGWDGNYKGEALPSATYIYYAEVEFIDGAIIQVKGDVNLLR